MANTIPKFKVTKDDLYLSGPASKVKISVKPDGKTCANWPQVMETLVNISGYIKNPLLRVTANIGIGALDAVAKVLCAKP